MDIQQLYTLQECLAKKVSLVDGFENLERIAGSDISYAGDKAYCAVVVLSYPGMNILEEKTVETKVTFPYIPTLLAFREIEPLMEGIKGLEFDILLVDGQGIAHPRGLGIASHLGALTDIATIGVAKSILCGDVKGEIEIGREVPLVYKERQVGYALKTKKGTRPIYISPGHKVSMESSIGIVKTCIKDYKLPEPTRIAHYLAERAKRG